MSIRSMRRVITYGAALAVLAGCASEAPAQRSEPARDGTRPGETAAAAESAELAVELEAVRAATRRFRDVEVALAEGYIRDPADMCYDAPMEGWPPQLGGMGIHFVRPDLLGITGTEPRVTGTGTHTDFRTPGVLVYEPQPDGSLELVAVENMIFVQAWEEAGNTEPPAFYGNEYYLMHDNPETAVDEAHGFAPHYELHIYLYRENPNGLFAQFNPNVTCAHHAGGGAAH